MRLCVITSPESAVHLQAHADGHGDSQVAAQRPASIIIEYQSHSHVNCLYEYTDKFIGKSSIIWCLHTSEDAAIALNKKGGRIREPHVDDIHAFRTHCIDSSLIPIHGKSFYAPASAMTATHGPDVHRSIHFSCYSNSTIPIYR